MQLLMIDFIVLKCSTAQWEYMLDANNGRLLSLLVTRETTEKHAETCAGREQGFVADEGKEFYIYRVR